MNKIQEKRIIIDDIDNQIISLIKKRFNITDEISKIKKKEGIPLPDLARKEEIIFRLKENNPDLDPKFIEKIYNIIHDQAIKRA